MHTSPSRLVAEVITKIIRDGYEVIDTRVFDWGITVKLDVRKDGEMFTLPLREAFYDTDDDGNISKVHGVLDIRDTPWFRAK